MSGFKGVEALVEYMKALEAMSARKAAVKQIAPVEDEESSLLVVAGVR